MTPMIFPLISQNTEEPTISPATIFVNTVETEVDMRARDSKVNSFFLVCKKVNELNDPVINTPIGTIHNQELNHDFFNKLHIVLFPITTNNVSNTEILTVHNIHKAKRLSALLSSLGKTIAVSYRIPESTDKIAIMEEI